MQLGGSLISIAAESTRPVLWQTPAWAEVLWYALAVTSVLVFLYGVLRPIAKYRRGRSDTLPSAGEIQGRIREAAGTLLSHARLRRRDAYAGWAHAGIFYGFAVLFIGTVVLAVNSDFTEPLFGWRFFSGPFYLGYSLVLDVLGVALLVGVLMMMIRRALIRPRKLDYVRPDREGEEEPIRRAYRIGDWVFVLALLYLVLTGYLLEGVRIAMESPGYDGFSPFGWVSARLFVLLGLGESALATIRHVIWWSHGLVAIVFVASIPFTKAAHMLESFASTVLRDPRAGKRLRPIPEALAEEPVGYGVLADFSVQHLLQLDACTKCGRCHEACPANATGLPLSPRDVVLELREEANRALAGEGIGGVLGSLIRGGDPDGRFAASVIGPDRVRADTLWSCMQCNACVEACPVGIEQAPMINQMRRRLVEEGDIDAGLQSAFQAIQKAGNSFGERARKRGRWTEGLDFEVKDAREEPVDVLWFVGDYASFDPRSQEVTRTLARLYHEAGVDYGILYDGERNAGNDIRRAGEEGLFEALRDHNTALFGECEFGRVVTSDPHSLNTLGNEYDLGGRRVMHHTAFLLELLEAGRIPVRQPLSKRITYHDPCYLGRFNSGYEAPRRILELIGCELVEMPRNRDNSFCCGAGGGRIWINEPQGTERPAENRIREAIAVGELDFFVVSCPKDATMYEDAIKTTGSGEALALRELTELVAAAAAPAAAEPAVS